MFNLLGHGCSGTLGGSCADRCTLTERLKTGFNIDRVYFFAKIVMPEMMILSCMSDGVYFRLLRGVSFVLIG